VTGVRLLYAIGGQEADCVDAKVFKGGGLSGWQVILVLGKMKIS
jgi:hypothetical protein